MRRRQACLPEVHCPEPNCLGCPRDHLPWLVCFPRSPRLPFDSDPLLPAVPSASSFLLAGLHRGRQGFSAKPLPLVAATHARDPHHVLAGRSDPIRPTSIKMIKKLAV